MKVLVCEDDEIMRRLIGVALEGEECEVTYASNGLEAMNQLKKNNEFDLIITDIYMPYHNGDEILKLVREVQGKQTPFFLISSDNQEEVIALALKAGVNEYIKKPIDVEKLKKAVRKYRKG